MKWEQHIIQWNGPINFAHQAVTAFHTKAVTIFILFSRWIIRDISLVDYFANYLYKRKNAKIENNAM